MTTITLYQASYWRSLLRTRWVSLSSMMLNRTTFSIWKCRQTRSVQPITQTVFAATVRYAMGKFNRYGCVITHSQFKTPNNRKTYRLSDITRVSLSRAHAFMLLPLHVGILSLIYSSSDLLYAGEILFGLMFVIIVGGVSFSIGVINVTGKFNLQGFATIGLYWQMAEVKEALDAALERTERSGRRR